MVEKSCQQESAAEWLRKHPELMDYYGSGKSILPWKEKKRLSLRYADVLERLAKKEVFCDAISKELVRNPVGDGFYKRRGRVLHCANYLEYGAKEDSGEQVLINAEFCRERLCPMCTWRLSRRVYSELSRVTALALMRHRELVPILATFTLKNVPGGNEEGDKLAEGITHMLRDGWRKLMAVKPRPTRVARVVRGWFRALEITYNRKKDTFHPHLHCIMLVDKSYFSGKDYISQQEWRKLWQKACGVDYDPWVDVRRCYGQGLKGQMPRVDADYSAGQMEISALAEGSKYAAKSADYLFEDNLEESDRISRQLMFALKGRRLHAYGGLLKEIAKELDIKEEDDKDLIGKGDGGIDTDAETWTYRWHKKKKGYFYYQRGEKEE